MKALRKCKIFLQTEFGMLFQEIKVSIRSLVYEISFWTSLFYINDAELDGKQQGSFPGKHLTLENHSC